MASSNRISVILVLLWFLVGCGVEPGESDFEDQHIDDHTDPNLNHGTPPAEELGEGVGAGTMSGTWLMVHLASSCVLRQEQVSVAYYLVDIEEQGASLRETRRLCHLELSELLGFRPVPSPEVLASVEFPQIDGGMISSLLVGGTYVSSTEVGLWGVDLDDPILDALPVDASDERVIDGEGDGNPGVSMKLEGSGCERYMGQRQIVKYFGTLSAPNDIRGQSATITETEVYGASGSICSLAPSVDPNDEHSLFRMVRVDGLGGSVDADTDGDGVVSCQEAEPFFESIWEVRSPDSELCE